jgi:hypothetical protein
MKATSGLPASATNQGANHILYVEGNDESLDVTVLGELLGSMMRVRPLGNCHSLKSVARALFPYNKDWWFIIDRDNHDDVAVEKTWRDFPDPSQHNLLIWRRKELENYLLEPAWLTQSRYILAGRDEETLSEKLREAADRRLWFEAANLVLRALREEVKGAQTELLRRGAVTVDDEAHALDAMRTSTMLSTLKNAADVDLSDQALAERLNAEVQRLSGGALPLQWGVGRWRDLMPGKGADSRALARLRREGHHRQAPTRPAGPQRPRPRPVQEPPRRRPRRPPHPAQNPRQDLPSPP